MKNLILICCTLFAQFSFLHAQSFHHAVSWGGDQYDVNPRMALDDEGNLFVAGFFKGTVDFNPGPGVMEFESGFDGFINDGYVTRFDAAGNFQWALQFQATIALTFTDMIVAANGNLILTGSYSGSVDFEPGPGNTILSSVGDSYDAFMLELDRNGQFIQVLQVASGGGTESARTLTETSNGDIIVTGIFTGNADLDPGPLTESYTAAGINDVFISRISDADLVWTKVLQGDYQAASTSIAVDGGDNVYVAGIFDDHRDFDPGPDSSYLMIHSIWDAFILKLDQDGNFIWVRHLGQGGDDEINSIAIGKEDDLYVAGYFSEEIDIDPGVNTEILTAQNFDPFVLKLSPEGNKLWAAQFTGISFDQIRSIDLDANDNLFMTGWYGDNLDIDPGPSVHLITSTGANDNNDVFVVKLDEDGQLLWGHTAGGSDNDYGEDILLDADNNVYIAGTFFGNAGFDPHGFITDSLASNGSGDFFLTKWSDCLLDLNVQHQVDQLVSLHSNADVYQWLNCDQNFAPVSGAQSQLFQPSSNGTYAVVVTDGECTDTSECITYVSTAVSDDDHRKSILIYPNPSNGPLFIESPLANTTMGIMICDLSGRVVYNKRMEDHINASHIIPIQPGTYFARITHDQGVHTFKWIVQGTD